MRRILLFILALTIPVGFLLGAHKSIDALQDDVLIELIDFYGDPERIAGKRVRLMTTCGPHMRWYTDYTAGAESQTQFHFSQKDETQYGYTWEGFSLDSPSGMGMSTSGGGGFTFADTGMGKLLNTVAEKTEPGQTREETLRIKDYLDYYPLDYQVDIRTEKYYINEGFSEIQFYSGVEEDEVRQCYQTWTRLFRFPVQPEDVLLITVSRDADGAVRDIGVNMDGSESAAYVWFSSHSTEEGLYFSPVFQDGEGKPITTGEFPEGYGLYYIPYKPTEHAVIVDGQSVVKGTFDFDGLELVYALEPSDELMAMEESADGSALHLLTREEGTYCYSLLDLQSRRIETKLEILTAERGMGYSFYPEQELLMLKGFGQAALVKMGGDAQVELLGQWPDEWGVWLPESILYENGVLYGASLEWYEKEYAVCLTVFDSGGLDYCGYYGSNLNNESYHSGSAYIQKETVELIKTQ